MNKFLAPNGKPSNLTPEQYKLVRTPAFKEWFGDWEKLILTKINDSGIDEISLKRLEDGVSKVVDENGEPLVVYHGTDKYFNTFKLADNKKLGWNIKEYGIYFTNSIFTAKQYSYEKAEENQEYLEWQTKLEKLKIEQDWEGWQELYSYGVDKYKPNPQPINPKSVRILKCFLNIRNPFVKKANGSRWFIAFKNVMETAINNNDGVIVENVIEMYNDMQNTYVAFESNQIKFADGTNTLFDAGNPDIRFEDGGELYSEISKEINEINALTDKDLTPMQLQYLNKKLLFFPSDKMNTLREINHNLWQDLRRKQRNVEDILKNKQTKKGVAGYLNEKYVYHFTTIFNLTDIIESKSIGNWQELGHIISLTTNPIFGEVEVSGVKSWNQGMDIKNAQFFSDLSVKIVFDLQKIKADGVKITKGSGKTGTHFGEYELIIPQFNEKDKWWKYVSWIEIDTNKKEIKELLDYKWVKERNIKDVMQLPIDIWIKGKQAESTLGVELKKLGIEVREREKIDVEKYLFGDKKPKYAEGGLIAPNGKPSKLKPEQYKLVRTPAFKEWFGDWENDPENASKVVDENGEPLVVYHGTNSEFNIFKLDYSSTNTGSHGFLGSGFYFATNKKDAEYYGNKVEPYFIKSVKNLDLRDLDYKELAFLLPNLTLKSGKKWKDAFIEKEEAKKKIGQIQKEDLKNGFYNIHYLYNGEWFMIPRRSINEISSNLIEELILDRIIDKDTENIGAIGNYFNPQMLSEEIKNQGYDSVFSKGTNIFDKGDELVVFEPTQIKLADGSNTTFNGNNPDIRFDEGGELNKNVLYVRSFTNKLKQNVCFLKFSIDSIKDIFISKEIKINKNNFHKYTICNWRKVKSIDFISDYISDSGSEYMYSKDGVYRRSNHWGCNVSTCIWLLNGDYLFSNSTTIGFAKYDDFFTYYKDYNQNTQLDKRESMILKDLLKKSICENEFVLKNRITNKLKIKPYIEKNIDLGKSVSLKNINIELENTLSYDKGGRTIAQTPAPKKDQIKGSDKNKEGSSKDLKSAKKIELSDSTIEAIKNKVDKHNEKHPKKKITIDSAKAVVRRGMGAYSSSYRPTISGGKPNSRVAWGLARLNAFMYKIVNGKSKSGKYSQDNDLIEELGYKVQKYANGGLVGNIFTEIIYRAILSTETTTDIYAKGNDLDKIKSEYDSISADDFDNPNSIGNSKILDRIINKYEFIGDDTLNSEDYIDDLQNTDFWNLIEEDFDEIEFDSVDAINKSTDEMIDEIREFIKQEYNIGGRYASKYMTISVDDENEDFIADLNIRTADHSQNYRNNDSTSYNLSFVIANKNATQGRFIPLGEEYYYDDNADIEDIKEEIKGVIDEKIEYIKEKGRKYSDGGDIQAYEEAMGISQFDEGGETKPKKVYVSIKLPNKMDYVYNEKGLWGGDRFSKYDDQPFQELKNHQLIGIRGVSLSPNNVGDWFSYKDCLVVMNYDEFFKLNDATKVKYDDPYQLMANDLKIFNRLYGNSEYTDEREKKTTRRENLKKIIEKIPFYFDKAKYEYYYDDAQKRDELQRYYYILGNYRDNFIRWIIDNEYIINSPNDLTERLIEFAHLPNSESGIDNYRNFNLEKYVLSAEDIFPIVMKGLIKAGSTYTDEAEVIINNKLLNLPNKTQLFFKKEDFENSDLQDLIDKYELEKTYRVYSIKSQYIKEYQDKLLVSRTKRDIAKWELGKEQLEIKKELVLNDLQKLFFDKSLDKINKILDEKYPSTYYFDWEGEETKYYRWNEVIEVQFLLNKFFEITLRDWKSIFQTKKANEISSMSFYALYGSIEHFLKQFIEQNRDYLENINKYHNENGDYLWLYDIERAVLGVVSLTWDEENGISHDELAKKYFQMIGGELTTYYKQDEIVMPSIYKDGGETELYHGSEKKFKKFKTNLVDRTDYGWGIYFTDSEDVAKYYARRPFDRDIIAQKIIQSKFSTEQKYLLIDTIRLNLLDLEKSKITLDKKYHPLINQIQKEVQNKSFVYEADVLNEKWLDWDKKVPVDIKRILKNIDDKYFINGETLYNYLTDKLNSQKNASLFLLDKGINGIKYLITNNGFDIDGYNYVVFDVDDIEIKSVDKYKDGGESDEPTEFWGTEAGGVLVYCSTTERYLILLRSEWVLEPNTWGIISGKLDNEENVQEAVLREAEEETGHKLGHLIPSFIFEKPNFKFHNFVSIVEEEFTPELDWENSDYKWVKLNEMPDNLHFGLKLLIEKEDLPKLIEKNKNNAMNKYNPKDEVTFNIPLLIRYSELMREDIKTDVALHEIVENLLEIKDKGTLTMRDYDSIVGNVIGTEENPEEEKMEEGGKVESIKSKKGDIKLSLEENWYSDDTDVELVPVAELIKFREFDRKVSPKYNKENSVDNINHLKFMFQKDGVKSPLIIEYSKEDNAVLIIEGNHRLNSAIDLGMEYLPARVVLKKYSKFSPSQLKNAMKVSGVTADESGYISSNLKPSQVGIEGTMPIYADGGIIEGRLHSECDMNEGCGRKFQVGENGHIIEAERDEAVIVADAFDDNENYTVKGTPSEIASALNVMGGGKNFDKGAEIIKNGQELEMPELEKEATDTDVADVIDSGSIIINRRSMADEKEYEVTGTPKQIASAINSINGNGVVIEKGAEIKEN